MEPGGIEPIQNQAPGSVIADFEGERATLRAIACDSTLAELIDAWPKLDTEARAVIALVVHRFAARDHSERAGGESRRPLDDGVKR